MFGFILSFVASYQPNIITDNSISCWFFNTVLYWDDFFLERTFKSETEVFTPVTVLQNH